MTTPRWMAPTTLAELDAEDQARREEAESHRAEPEEYPDIRAGELPDYTPCSLKHVDRHIEGTA